VFVEGVGEVLLGGGFEFLAEVGELLADVATFDAAGDVCAEKAKGEGGEWGVLAAEDCMGLDVCGGAAGEEVLLEDGFGFGADGAGEGIGFGVDVGDELSSVGDDRLGAAETDGEWELGHFEFTLENVKGIVVRAGESVDGLVAVTDDNEAATGGFDD
jgi:hypothetical protein